MKPSKATLNKVWILIVIMPVFIMTGLLSFPTGQTDLGPSYIIVAIEKLSFHSFSCSDDKSISTSGLSTLCKEAIRFTHAYSTSTQPTAGLASLMTGQYPFRHRLSRSSDRLDANIPTLAQVAQRRGLRTAFFSGNPNVLRRTGLYRGFDYFDDHTLLNFRNYTVPVKQQLNQAMQWITGSRQTFVSVVHSTELDNLNQSETETTTFDKLDEQLAVFFADLKDRGLWDKNFVIVVGLNGLSDLSRPQETDFSNLHSENTNVIGFVKPPRQKGDDGIYWKVDTPLNLADLGLSLMKSIDPGFLALVDSTFPIKDYSSLWLTESATKTEGLLNPRRLLIESVNPWSKEKQTRYAVHYKNLFFVENENDELYNTLTDGLETNDISSTAHSAQNDFMNENRKIFGELRKNRNMTRWKNFRSEWQNYVELNRRYWVEISQRNAILDQEIERFKNEKVSQPLTGLAVLNTNVRYRNEIAKITKANPFSISDRDRELYQQILRLHSLNLALENAWQIWKPDLNWTQSNLIVEYQ